jgi:hypothetical protein
MSAAKTLASAALSLLSAFATIDDQTADAPARSLRISGAVVDASGNPAQHEAVTLTLAGAQDSLMIPTDRGGKFFAAVQPGRYVLSVQVPYSIATRQEVDASDGRDINIGTLQLRQANLCDQVIMTRRRINLDFLHPARTYRLSGKVVDAQGGAVIGASVILRVACYRFGASTGPDGTFHVRHVPPPQFTFQVKGTGFLPFENLSLTVGNKNTDLGTITVGTGSGKMAVR